MAFELTYSRAVAHIGTGLTISFKGTNYGDGPEDTEVRIEEGVLCAIQWKDKEAFTKELVKVIEKYSI
jgi:hypothetical protein